MQPGVIFSHLSMSFHISEQIIQALTGENQYTYIIAPKPKQLCLDMLLVWRLRGFEWFGEREGNWFTLRMKPRLEEKYILLFNPFISITEVT